MFRAKEYFRYQLSTAPDTHTALALNQQIFHYRRTARSRAALKCIGFLGGKVTALLRQPTMLAERLTYNYEYCNRDRHYHRRACSRVRNLHVSTAREDEAIAVQIWP